MSQPPSSSAPQPPPPPHLPFSSSSTAAANREYRKGNWTLQETLTIITAKKLDDERRSAASSSSSSKPGELRWKWVENYCWSHACFRSQNQCNDKWDNLLRDYKKIRDYQSRSDNNGDGSDNNTFPSYWSMDRHQRKYYNLPSNMSIEIFEALDEVIQRRFLISNNTQQLPPPPPPPQQQQQFLLPAAVAAPTPVTVVPEKSGGLDTPAVSEGSESSSATESSDEKVDSSSKRRRKVKNIGGSIKRSASIIAQTLRNCEEKKEKRHQEAMEYEQRRLQLEETRNEVNKQGMTSLVMAVTNLSTAIQSFISADQTSS